MGCRRGVVLLATVLLTGGLVQTGAASDLESVTADAGRAVANALGAFADDATAASDDDTEATLRAEGGSQFMDMEQALRDSLAGAEVD